jgi:hypothetical protein
MVGALILVVLVASVSACGTEEADLGDKTEYFVFSPKAGSSENVEPILRPGNSG